MKICYMVVVLGRTVKSFVNYIQVSYNSPFSHPITTQMMSTSLLKKYPPLLQLSNTVVSVRCKVLRSDLVSSQRASKSKY